MNGQLAEGGVGNLVRGTLGRHRRTGRRYPFLDPETLKPLRKSLDVQLEYLMEAKVNSLQQVAEALAWMTGRRVPAQTAQVVAEHSNGDGIAELKAAIGDLYNFLSQYVELDERGRGSCPFHPPDRNPSFAVNREEGYWICFHETNPDTGRYLDGDAIGFYRRLKGWDFREAVAELTGMYFITDPGG